MNNAGSDGEASAGAAVVGGGGLFDTNHESFLEEIARQECKDLRCKVHQSMDEERQRRNSAEDDDDDPDEQRRRFMLLDFTSDDDDDSDSSEEETSSSEEDDTEQDVSDEGDNHDEMDDEDGVDDHGFIDMPVEQNEEENDADVREENEIGVVQAGVGSYRIEQPLSPSSFPGLNPVHQRLSYLLICLANSEERPLIRADIPWSDIISCGSSFMTLSQASSVVGAAGSPHRLAQSQESLLQSLYKYQDDPNGARLLQGVLRMDPPLEAVQVLVDAFPLSCVDMEGFFTACQFAHPNTSRRLRGSEVEHKQAPVRNDISDDDTDDVGEVVKLVMNHTIRARQLNSIDWGMVAFLGDARISPSHAKLLLRHAPEALIDPKHGAFGVSPLDRMASGVFIHGEQSAWVEKLRLALRTAAYVRLRRKDLHEGETISLPRGFFSPASDLLRRRESANIGADDSPGSLPPLPAQLFYPYHELIRLLISPDFQGNKFGRFGFLQTLKACTQSDPDAFLRPDNNGNLPLHTALSSECETVLGTKGERRLIKYMMSLDQNMALCPEGSIGCSMEGGMLPLRLSVKNAWPVHDVIIKSAFACCDTSPPKSNDDGKAKDLIANSVIFDRPLLHDVLSGPYHPRFGVHGARQLVKNTISRITSYRHQNKDRSGLHSLANFIDAKGRRALHVALASKWPVYDVLVRANPNAIEAHDPTCHSFYPFQVAACAFTASGPDKEAAKTAKEKVGCGHIEEAVLETSMLFELIRESPLCVTWKMPNENDSLDADSALPPKKKRRTSSP